MHAHYEILVSGRVQGVGFRAASRKQARYLQLNGWVENLTDGTVRIRVSGEMEQCTRFISWCREGSAYSWVEGIDIREITPEHLGPFRIVY
jgi:acylphosphatase